MISEILTVSCMTAATFVTDLAYTETILIAYMFPLVVYMARTMHIKGSVSSILNLSTYLHFKFKLFHTFLNHFSNVQCSPE